MSLCSCRNIVRIHSRYNENNPSSLLAFPLPFASISTLETWDLNWYHSNHSREAPIVEKISPIIVSVIVVNSNDTADTPEDEFENVAAEVEFGTKGYAELVRAVGVNEDLEDGFEDLTRKYRTQETPQDRLVVRLSL